MASQGRRQDTLIKIYARATAMGAGVGALSGAVAGAALLDFGLGSPDSLSGFVGGGVIGAIFGALVGTAVGISCGVVIAVFVMLTSRFFAERVWLARLAIGILTGGLLAALAAWYLRNEPGSNSHLPLVMIAFAIGAIGGAYSAGYMVTGRSCTVVRRLCSNS